MTRYYTETRPGIEAFDTETLRGFCTLICCPYDALYNSDLSPIETVKALDWLYHHTGRGGRLGFFFNLSFDVAAILKEGLSHFNENQLQTFRKTKEATFGDYKIFYIVNKGLNIQSLSDRRMLRCFDISTLLFDGTSKGTLEYQAQKHLGVGKLNIVDPARLNVDPDYWRSMFAEVLEYCKRDALLTRQLAAKVLDYSKTTLHFYPSMLYSKASLSKAWLQQFHKRLERQFMHVYRDRATGEVRWASRLGLTEEQLDLIYQAFFGGIFDVWWFGHIDNVTEIDINSAYPWAISQLPRLDTLEAERGDSYDPKCITGIYKIQMPYGRYPMPYREKYWIAYPAANAVIEKKAVRRHVRTLATPPAGGLALHSPAVVDLAEKLFFQRQVAAGNYQPTTPELYELEEGGYLLEAQQQLLHGFEMDGATEEGELLSDEQIVYPNTGDNQQFIHYTTKPKLDFFQSRGISFKVLDSLQFYGEHELEFPDFPELYSRRLWLQMQREQVADQVNKRKYHFQQYMLKIVLNAVYGSEAQLKQGQGSFTNLIHAALITTMTHVKIYELMERIGFDDVVSIATDGIKYMDHGQQLPCGPMLGECKKSFEKATVTMFENGIYFVEQKNEVLEFRKRGLPTLEVEQLKTATGEQLCVSWDKPYRLLQALSCPAKCRESLQLVGVWLPHTYRLSLKDVCRKRIVPGPWTFERFNTEPVPSEPVFHLSGSSATRPLPKPKMKRWMKAK